MRNTTKTFWKTGNNWQKYFPNIGIQLRKSQQKTAIFIQLFRYGTLTLEKHLCLNIFRTIEDESLTS